MTSPSTGTPTPGARRLRHFRVDRPLGEGGMGQVFLGYDLSLERPVALKVVRPELTAVPGFLERFLREARAQAQVAHSNVVQVYFVGEEQGTWFMAMELVDGGSLEEVLRQKQRLSWGQAVGHLIDLGQGLREAARLGIVHRDIKPANILLDRFGQAHLADFGLATAEGAAPEPGVPAAPALPRLTQLGSVLGSPQYMSPEHARGAPVDARSDIYSLGATFYELLAGLPPIPARTIPETQAFHQSQRPLPLRERAPRVPRPVARIIDRCLAPRPDDRFPDYDALLTALRAAAPRPLVNARVPQRLLAWLLDLAVAIGVTRLTLQTAPLLGVAVQALWVCGLGLLLGATPGQWLMRVQLRTPEDGEVTPARMATRFLLQFGWEVPAVLALTRLYASEMDGVTQALGLAAVIGFGVIALGSLAVLWSRTGLTWHDHWSGTRVLLDVR